MNRMHPQTLLFVLLGTVPLVVSGSGLAAFLLMRAGYGLLVWAVLPFFVSLLLVAALAFALSRAAGGRQAQGERRPPEGRSRGGNGV